jgi:hypothetical protein
MLCSDSFFQGGDAHGQYNIEPFLNKNKSRLEPNYSFDLCRLSCSIYDFLFDDDTDMSKLSEPQKIILKWCEDDFGKNILYKKNGSERYPNFKLYKMISRLVHNKIPSEQLDISSFKQYKLSKPNKIPNDVVNIDELPAYSYK